MALSGVDIMEVDGKTFKSTYQILDELAQKWQDLTDIQQATITELIAGKRQGNIVSSLMNNFQTARDALETSMNSSGSAMAEHEKWMESVEAGINKVKAAWQSLSQSFLKSDFLKGLLKTVESLISGIGKLVDTFGTLPTLFTLFAGGRSLFAGKGFFKPIIDEATGVAKGITTTFGRTAKSVNASLSTINVRNGFSQTLDQNDITAIRNYSNAVQRGVSSTTAFNRCMGDASGAAKTYALSGDAATKSVSGFVESQQASNVSTLAQNKSLGSARALMSEYQSGCKTTGMSQTAFADAVKKTNPQLAAAMASTNSASAEMKAYTLSLIGAKIASGALKVASMALNMALTMGISLLVSGLFSAISKWINKEEELAEKVDEVTSKYKEQHKELQKLKGDYDTSNESSMISRYEKLSKGVDQLGRNVSLTTEEYSEYQSIVNQIADQIPSLISGYDSQGNAILGVKGNVKELVKEYENLIAAENRSILNSSGDIYEDFENVVENTNSREDGIFATKNNIDDIKYLDELLNSGNVSDKTLEIQNRYDGTIDRISNSLERLGFEKESGESYKQFVDRVFAENRVEIKRVVETFYADLEAETEGMKSIAQAVLSNAFDISDSDYYGMSDTLKGVAKQVVNGFDYEFFAGLQEKGISVEQYVNDMLAQLDAISARNVNSIEAAFNLKTQFNGGDISYGEYVKGLEDTGKLIDNLNLTKELKTQLKLSIGLNEDGFVEEYKNLVTRLSDHTNYDFDPNIQTTSAEMFLNSLSAEELSVAVDVITEMSDNGVQETIHEIREAIEREMLIRGLFVDLDIKVETTALEALNTALAESKSATGLTVESIDALKARYKDLAGYNVATLFEETANGIRINSTELAKLESEYKKLNKQDLDETLKKLVDEYNELTVEINNCQDASKRADLYSQRDSILDQINDTATLAAQYEGLTSAYNEWHKAQEAGQDRDQYESVLSGREEIEGEMSRGWLDDAAIEYLELLTGEELSTAGIDAQIAAYKELNDTIGDTEYSIWDFFTKDEEGNATSDGVFNFFDTVKSVAGETAAWVDENGKYHFNFEGFEYEGEVGDAAIAKMLGTSEELVQIILKAAEDAGFVVDIKGDYTDLANLKKEAEIANDRMKELEATTYTFNFDSTNVDDLNKQIGEAETMLSNLKNEDGTLKVGVSEEDYRKAQDMIAALIYQKQSLDGSAILHVDTSQANSDIENTILKLQEFRQYTNTLELQVAIGADTSETITNIQSTLDYINGLDKGIQASLGLKTEEVQAAINNVQANIQAGVAIKQEDLDIINAAISSISNDMMVEIGLNETLIDNFKAAEHTAEGTVNWDNNIKAVTDWINQPHEASGTVNWGNNTNDVQRTFFGNGFINWTVSEANGTANANGSSFAMGTANGRAFKQGDWGIKDSGTALGGELGTEVLVRDGRWYTIGDNGAEFFQYKKGDIIFNHRQTEELFANGKVTSGGGRGKALAEGTAFKLGSIASGIGRDGISSTQQTFDEVTVKKLVVKDTGSTGKDGSDKDAIKGAVGGNNNSGGGGGGGGGSKDKNEFEETIDWIEIAIDRIERAIDQLDQKANNIYKSWSDRNSAIVSEISKVGDEIELQQKAYDRYLQEANSVGLSEDWAAKVRDGKVDIETVTDEELKNKIDEYRQWYEKAIDCRDAIEDLKEKESELYAQRFENIQTQYDGILQGYEHTENMLNEYISQAEEQGYIVSKKYYQALINNEKSNIDELKREQADLIAARDEAVESGTIVKGSEAWLEQCAAIDEVTQAIEESATALLEFDNAMRDIDWQIFDLIQERISGVAEEADFLIELMSNKKLFEDDGKLTSQGLATMGLHAQNYNTHMYAADEYGAEVAKLNKQIAEDPYDQELINRRNEMLELQRESILAAEDEKNAIRDMVEEGIEFELDALQELIDKKNEELESEKDLYEYQKKVKKQTSEIASIEKQMAAYSGDDSDEARAKIQELKVSLEEAKSELQEAEMDRYISDQSKILDELYLEYETILNTRLDNIDYLLESVIDSINASTGADGAIASALGSEGAIAIAVSNNATSIKDTLASETNKVGATLSNAMNSIWNTGDGNAKSVLTMYGEDFKTKSTTIITTLNGIKFSVNSMVASLNKEATAKTNANKTTTSAKKNPTKTNTVKTKKATTKKSGGDGKPKVGDKVTFVSGQYYYDSQGKKPLGSKYQGKQVYITNINTKDWATHGYHISTGNKLGKGDLGWLKLNQIKGYTVGKNDFLDDEIAWTQEDGKEFIVRPSDGAILTPIAKGDSILTSAASNNIWNMANSPAEFIKDNLGIGDANVPNNSSVQNSCVQHFENITFSLPNVHSYNELLVEMQRDPKFEKLILAMTVDQIAGRSKLNKGKAIR